MSLPQHKKSAEEIAKLRESLGIPGQGPDADAPPPEPPVAATAKADDFREAVAPLPEFPALPRDKAPHESKALPPHPGSGQVPVLAVEINGPPPHEEPVHTHVPEPVAPPVAAPVHPPKQVRSLRKSEQGPVPIPHRPPADSPLPVHRHSEHEIKVIRRNEALAPHAPIPHPKTLIAHPVIYVPAYLLAIAGAVCCFYYDLALLYPAVCEGLALLIALFIIFKKPLSRHHGAFIAVMALLVVVFGALHYFPNLRYGT
jgi:hypothetical protein